MTTSSISASSPSHARAALHARLQARRAEIEEVAISRIHSVSETPATVDPAYRAGLLATVSAALDYALAGVELGSERLPALPPALLSQARLAARNAIGLDAVLRRYVAGSGVLNDF